MSQPPKKVQQVNLKRLGILGALTLLLLMGLAYLTGTLDAFDFHVQDSWYMSERPVDTQIILIGIDDRALKEIGQWPWSREVLADIVTEVSAGKPKAIGLDILLSEPGDQSEALASAIKAAKVVVLPVAGQFNRQSQKVRIEKQESNQGFALNAKGLVAPLSQLAEGATLGHINVLPDYADGIVRRIEPFIKYQNQIYPTFAQSLWQVGTGQTPSPIADFRNPPFIDFVGKTGGFGIISAADIIAKKVPPAYFKNAYVILGPTALGLLEDRYLTSIDRQYPMNGVEIHANILQGLLETSTAHTYFKKEASLWIEMSMMIGLMILIWVIGSRFTMGWGAVLAIMGAAIYVVGTKWGYGAGLRITVLYPLVGAALMYLWLQAVRFAQALFEKRRLKHLFSQYVAPEVVAEILQMNDANLLLESHRREVTVLFVDVRGFTPLSEHTAPEVVVQVLNAYLTVTSDAIFSERGTVDKFIGDATMAVFNAPLDLPGHAMAAIRAAMAMRAAADTLAADLSARFGVDLSFGIGIHTGPAIVGNIGSAHRLDYTAIGDTVNTAARLESKAGPSEILVSQEVVALTEHAVSYTYVGEIPLKGKQNPVLVYRAESLL